MSIPSALEHAVSAVFGASVLAVAQDQGISLTWETAGAMCAIAGTIVGVGIAYLRLFVKSELLDHRNKIVEKLNLDMKDVIALNIGPFDRRIEKLEEQQDERIERERSEREQRQQRRGQR